MHIDYTEADFTQSPLMFYYEITQACDLVCEHCRASAKETADPQELSHEQSLSLIDQDRHVSEAAYVGADRR
jgi:AdoMet-dependent heme synthase